MTDGFNREAAAAAAAPGVLQGIRVLDFSRYIAGPYCASILGDLGAEVIRIEPPGGADDRFLLKVEGFDDGAQFMALNRNKKSLTMDLRSPRGREVLNRLVASADVTLTNMPPAALPRLGLDYASLKQANPAIISANVSAYGPQGPLSGRNGFDLIGQAMSGATYMSGWPGQPVRTSCNYVDFGTGLGTALGIMAAIMHRQQTGEGQEVQASLLQTALTFMNAVLLEASTGVERAPGEGRSPYAGPAELAPTKDGAVVVQVVGPAMFARLAEAIGRPELAQDPRFDTDEKRGEAGAELSAILGEWAGPLTMQEAMDALAQARIPSGPAFSPIQAINDPGVRGSGVFQDHHPKPDGPALPVAGFIARLSASPGTIRAPRGGGRRHARHPARGRLLGRRNRDADRRGLRGPARRLIQSRRACRARWPRGRPGPGALRRRGRLSGRPRRRQAPRAQAGSRSAPASDRRRPSPRAVAGPPSRGPEAPARRRARAHGQGTDRPPA